jgi:hypothetical protein
MSFAAGGPATSGNTAADRAKLFNGKALVTSAASSYQLSWPIVLWGVLLLVLYGISYNSLAHSQNTLTALMMTQKAQAAMSRLTYYTLASSLQPVRGLGQGGCRVVWGPSIT